MFEFLPWFLPMTTEADPTEKVISENAKVLKLRVYRNTGRSSLTAQFSLSKSIHSCIYDA